MRRPLLATMIAATALIGAFAGPADAHTSASVQDAFTTKTPYRPQGVLASYERPPAGFEPVFTENVSRHGSRTLSDSDDGDALIALWQVAASEHALTRIGQGLGPQVRRLLDANAAIGYGLLTPLGTREMETTAERMQQRLPGLFTGAQPIDVVAASQQRTVDSATAFVHGLETASPRVAPAIGAVRTDDHLLYFHKSNADYQNYVDNDPRVAAAETEARSESRTHAVARSVLTRIFTPAFVSRIAAGDYPTEFSDEIAAAESVYSLDQVTQDMPDEGPWRLNHYITPDETAWFGYLDDVTSFYENGPAFAGDDITYKMADGLLDDMFGRLEAKRDGTSPLAAELRFTHAEEIFPLATLLQLPGSTEQLPNGTLFTYANDPFRGAQVAPMGANIQWDLYRSRNTYLVRMLYNEHPTAFKTSCTPIRRGSYFYTLDELEQCYGRTPT